MIRTGKFTQTDIDQLSDMAKGLNARAEDFNGKPSSEVLAAFQEGFKAGNPKRDYFPAFLKSRARDVVERFQEGEK